jgi:hypothetical protein
MKIPLAVTLVGLAIGFVLPTFAQQKDTVDPELRQQLDAYDKKVDEAFNNGDAAALAATYTDDAVHVTPGRFTVGTLSRSILLTCSRNGITATISARLISIPLTL